MKVKVKGQNILFLKKRRRKDVWYFIKEGIIYGVKITEYSDEDRIMSVSMLDKQTYRQTDRETDMQTDMQTDIRTG